MHKRKNQARTIFHTQKSHGPTKIRGHTRTHAVSSITKQGPSHPAPILPHLSSSNRRLNHHRVWNPLRKLYRSRNSLPRTAYQKKKSIFRFWRNKQLNQRKTNTPIYTTEQIAAEIHREFNRGRSLSRSPSACSSLQQTVYSESFDLQRQLSRSPSPLSQYEQTTQMALHQCSPIVYSDLYFKHGVSLNARIYENGSLTQSINGILYQRNRLRYNRKYRDHMLQTFDSIEQLNYRTNYMPLYLSDDIKPKNFRALLIDCNVVNIDRIIINNQDFKSKCYEKLVRNEQSFQSYNAMIRLESGEIFEEYFFEKYREECYSRVHGCGINHLARYYYRHKSLERMQSRCNSTLSIHSPSLKRSPTLNRSPLSLRRQSSLPLSQSMLNLLHIDKYNLVNKSPDAIEKMLQRRQEIIQQIRSGNYSYDLSKLDLDKSLENFPNDPMMLEPLLATMHDIKQQDHYGRKARFNRVKQQTISRFIIGYTLAIFLLTILTFFILFFK